MKINSVNISISRGITPSWERTFKSQPSMLPIMFVKYVYLKAT